MGMPLTVDVVSDVVCPWCFIGKRRLEAALASRPDIETEIRWRPFFLDPTVPREGKPRIDYIRGKFGSVEKITPGHQRLIALGQDEGVVFNFADIETQPNTLDAHRVIGWAQNAGKAQPLVENLFTDFFVNGVNLADRKTLAAAAGRAGMDEARVSADLATEKDEELIMKQAQAASASGIGGVPFFVFGGKIALSGAQDPQVLVSAMEQAIEANR